MTERLPARYRRNPLMCKELGERVIDPNSGFPTYSGLCVTDDEGSLVNPDFGTDDERIDWRAWRRRTGGRSE